tara:strand:+ start:512 stop:658 length:147 start_codon:yes stop_codon:yes gene_type:complete
MIGKVPDCDFDFFMKQILIDSDVGLFYNLNLVTWDDFRMYMNKFAWKK